MINSINNVINKNIIAIQASIQAGREILKIYNTDFNIDYKNDNSPLTEADNKSNDIIIRKLKDEFPGIPVLSEESSEVPYEIRRDWQEFWLVDPLDGTKEFIKKNDEFTVNIALIGNQLPVFGVIYVPVKNELYLGGKGIGSFRIEKASEIDVSDYNNILESAVELPVNSEKNSTFTVVASRSHRNQETEDYISSLQKKHDQLDIVSAGSSLKFCLVAEGKADIYPRFGPTMEWDTAAGQAIAEGSGVMVIDEKTRQVMEYNKQKLRNDFFIVAKSI